MRTGAVAPAARDDAHGRFQAGEAVGFLGEEVIAWGEPAATLRAVLAALADGAELLSVLAGEDAPLDPAAVAALLDGELKRGARAAPRRPVRLLVAARRGVARAGALMPQAYVAVSGLSV